MSKLAVGVIGGTLGLGAVLGGGYAANKIYNNLNNSNTNSNVSVQQANSNTKPTKSIKSALLGTWVQTFKTDAPDNPKIKYEFTADEVITYEDGKETQRGKYKIFCGQFIELKDGESDAVYISKFTIEGDELTIAGTIKEKDRKFKREPSNTANTSTDTADSKTEEVTLNPKDMVGTWIDTEKPEFKYVFTEDQMTVYNNDQQTDEGKYKIPCGQILESTNERGSVLYSKVTIEGSEMTIYRNGEKTKLRREGGNAATETADENLTEKIKVFKQKLIGTWTDDGGKLIFTNDGEFLEYYEDNLMTHYHYRFIDDQTVEWNSENFKKDTAKVTFKDDNTTLVWELSWRTFEYKLKSKNADVNLGDSLAYNVIGNWVGITGTNSADERINVYLGSFRYWNTQQNSGNWNQQFFDVGSDGTVNVGYSIYKVTVANDVMTTEADGVVKKYNRLKTVVD